MKDILTQLRNSKKTKYLGLPFYDDGLTKHEYSIKGTNGRDYFITYLKSDNGIDELTLKGRGIDIYIPHSNNVVEDIIKELLTVANI